MKKVVIIGCGFGGISACKKLSRYKKEIEVTVIDRGEYFHFMPLIADVIGRGINSEYLRYPIKVLSEKYGFSFINGEAVSVNFEAREVNTASKKFNYDYLIISSGSEINFYGNEIIKKNALKLGDSFDGEKIRREFNCRVFDTLVIGGGGYSSMEIAGNARIYFNKHKQTKRIVIVERAPAILGPTPEWIKAYVLRNLKSLQVDILTNTVIDTVEGSRIHLSNGENFDNAMLIWAAGLKTGGFINDLKAEKTNQGRIKVDEFLKINDSVFVIGDAANFGYKGNFLRMAVHFAIAEGVLTAKNILSLIHDKPLRSYKPNDPGYIIPMVNNFSCGIAMGMKVKGYLATFLHYTMCIYRSYSLRNRLGLVYDLIFCNKIGIGIK